MNILLIFHLCVLKQTFMLDRTQVEIEMKKRQKAEAAQDHLVRLGSKIRLSCDGVYTISLCFGLILNKP